VQCRDIQGCARLADPAAEGDGAELQGPTALAGATPGGPGTTLAQAGSLVMLRQLKVHLRVSQAGAVLGDDGEVEQKTVMLIEKWLSGFCEFARRG